MTELARARDTAGLRQFADALEPGEGLAYERARAGALAFALAGRLDAALAELALGNAATWPAATLLTADLAHVRQLAGDGAGALATLGAASADAWREPVARDALVGAAVLSPALWRQAVGLSVRRGDVAAAASVVGLWAAAPTPRGVLVASGAAVAILGALVLPWNLLSDGLSVTPVPDVPAANDGTEVVAGPLQPSASANGGRNRGRDGRGERARREAAGTAGGRGSSVAIAFRPGASASSGTGADRSERGGTRPTAPRPAPKPGPRPGAAPTPAPTPTPPAPAPTPAPSPGPATPAPAPAPQAVETPSRSPTPPVVQPTPTPTPTPPTKRHGKPDKAKGPKSDKPDKPDKPGNGRGRKDSPTPSAGPAPVEEAPTVAPPPTPAAPVATAEVAATAPSDAGRDKGKDKEKEKDKGHKG